LLSCAKPDALAEKIVAQNLSVRDAEKLLEGAPESSGAKGEGPRKRGLAEKDADTRAMEKTLMEQLGMNMAIAHKEGETGNWWCATKPSTSWSFCAAACRAIDARRTALKGRPGSGRPTAMPSRFRAHTPHDLGASNKLTMPDGVSSMSLFDHARGSRRNLTVPCDYD
jgi:hypothetical protein